MLVLADKAPADTTDPPFAAHVLSIGHWAQAIWDGWRSREAMASDFARSRRRLAQSKHIWGAVSGPAGAFIASAARLGWSVVSFNRARDDLDVEWHLDRDSPELVKAAVVDSESATVAGGTHFRCIFDVRP